MSAQRLLSAMRETMTWELLQEALEAEIIAEFERLPEEVLDELCEFTKSENRLTHDSGEVNIDPGEVYLFLRGMKRVRVYTEKPDCSCAIVLLRRNRIPADLGAYEQFDDFILGCKKGADKDIFIAE